MQEGRTGGGKMPIFQRPFMPYIIVDLQPFGGYCTDFL